MLAAIASGDPYMWFAKMARLVPEWATAQTHEDVREICKRCCLGVLYGMGFRALAMRIKRSELEARELLEHHRRIFPTFWAWSNRAVHDGHLVRLYRSDFRLAHPLRRQVADGRGHQPTDPDECTDARQRRRDAALGRDLRAPGRDHHQLPATRRVHDRGGTKDERDAIQTMRDCMAGRLAWCSTVLRCGRGAPRPLAGPVHGRTARGAGHVAGCDGASVAIEREAREVPE